ncbi:MAG TPA: YceI family protein [Candidatus Polarisedimenticolia bacterium]|nr:YceI family protein [Candidatus Polarisedimenticolia bacterium]
MTPRSTCRTRAFRPSPATLVAAAALATLATFAAAPVAQAADTYTLDPNHTTVGFTVRHFFTKVPGKFTKFEGTIVYDSADLSKSTVNVTIETASIDTEVADRDKHLRSADFFDAEKNPKITFVSTKVKPMGANKAQIEGTLTIRGVTKTVTLDVDLLGSGPDAWGGYRAGFEAHTKINRMDYGVAWNRVVEGGGSVLGDDVDINLSIEAIRQAPKPAEAPKK